MPAAKKPATAKKAAKVGRKKDAIDLAVDLITPTLKFIKPNFRGLFRRMFKLNIPGFLSGMAIFIGYWCWRAARSWRWA